MKKKAILVLMILIFTSVFTACQKKAETTDSSSTIVEYEITHYDSYTEDGTLLYLASFVKPSVTLPGNTSVQDTVNQFFADALKGFQEQKDYFDIQAKDNYAAFLDTNGEDTAYNMGYSKDKLWDENYMGYCEVSRFTLTYAGDDYISFSSDYNDYLGGAHGTEELEGVTFSAKTGNLVSLMDIFPNDSEGFMDYVEAKIKEELESNKEYTDYLMDDYENYLDSFAYVDQGAGWYLEDADFVAVMQPYTVCAGAAGPIEIHIPMTELFQFQ